MSRLERPEEALVILEHHQKQPPEDRDIAKTIVRERDAPTFVKAATEAMAAESR